MNWRRKNRNNSFVGENKMEKISINKKQFVEIMYAAWIDGKMDCAYESLLPNPTLPSAERIALWENLFEMIKTDEQLLLVNEKTFLNSETMYGRK